MLKKLSAAFAAVMLVLAAYLLLWPVPIDPVGWKAPENRGYVGAFAPNDGMAKLKRIDLKGHRGPEDAAFGPDGMLYMATHGGMIVRYNPITQEVADFADTKGRPLGVEFSTDGKLYIADAYRGLLEISESGDVTVLTDQTSSGSAILYADDLDIAPDGSIYFSDASTKFGAKQVGDTLAASMLDLMEHGPNGRVLRFDPTNGETTIVADGMSFANGIAINQSGTHVLVVETGTYAIKKIALAGSSQPETIIDNLPGFPDNINRNADGTFWVGLVSPRSAPADAMSDRPFLRKVVMRLPAFMRPAAQRYGFVMKINEAGEVLETLQDASGGYAMTTGLIEGAQGQRYVTSLTEPDLGVIER